MAENVFDSVEAYDEVLNKRYEEFLEKLEEQLEDHGDEGDVNHTIEKQINLHKDKNDSYEYVQDNDFIMVNNKKVSVIKMLKSD